MASDAADNSNDLVTRASQAVLWRRRGHRVGLGLLLILAVYLAGSPALDAPWVPGDEFIFIVENPLVTTAFAQHVSPWRYLVSVFANIHEDLYQPLPIVTYAVEWYLSGGDAQSFRRTDLLLHAINTLLLWNVLGALLRRVWKDDTAGGIATLAWFLALLWAVHPLLVSTYASDMGRTHLLSGTFALVALRLHVLALAPGKGRYFVGALVALLLAMTSKAIPGWVVVVFGLEAALLGWRRALCSPRVYVVGVICLAFALLTIHTSRASGVMEDAALGLFGNPLSRSLLAVWIYVRNLLAPLWLSAWYLPDPATNWANPRVWVGLAITLASVLHAGWAWRRPDTRMATVGWVWFWVLLLPVIGLVGAREVAAADRYLYQPLMGLTLVFGAVLLKGQTRLAPPAQTRSRRVLAVGASAVAGVMLLWDRPHCVITRSALRRAERVVELNPGDPRALEMLAVAYDFARTYPLPVTDQPQPPAGQPIDPARFRFLYFNRSLATTLTHAAQAPDLARYFPGPGDRAPFHRRLSYRFLMAGEPHRALEQAEVAHALEPEPYLTWKRLAHANQALKRWADARSAYEQAETRLPDDPQTRAAHFTDFGDLLLNNLNRPDLARVKFAAALETGAAPARAAIGLALGEIRAGHGATGAQLITDFLRASPDNVEALLVLGEYHLRSHHWDEAERVYDAILQRDPRNYTALRGYHEVCGQVGNWKKASAAWDSARHYAPNDRAIRSFSVWTAACAGDAHVAEAATALSETDTDNPLACFTLMLTAVRAGDIDEAVKWVRAAKRGVPIPEARAHERAAQTLEHMIARGEIISDARLLVAVVWAEIGDRARARDSLGMYLAAPAEDRWQEVVAELQESLSRPD